MLKKTSDINACYPVLKNFYTTGYTTKRRCGCWIVHGKYTSHRRRRVRGNAGAAG
jgi:hypothetical protein